MLYYFKGLSDYADLAQAAAAFTFEYGRLKLLQNEQTLLTEYLSQQKQLDEDLDRKYESYRIQIEANQKQFDQLIDNAFDPGFRNTLRDSVALAKAAGVKEEEILDSMEKVDSFFWIK